MSTPIAVILGVVIVAIALAAAWFVTRRRSKVLQARFGPEYDRTVEETGSRTAAEARLERLQKQVERYNIRPLPEAVRGRYLDDWGRVQSEFVDNPETALNHAQSLVDEVMAACGYPMADFNQRAGELAVDHASVVEHYRAAHEIADRHEHGETGTEDLRQAMIHYRTLFDDLIGEHEPAPARRAQGVMP